jgi:histidine triad (HIT) family protein
LLTNPWRGRRARRKIDVVTGPLRELRERAMPSDCLFCRIVSGELPSAQVYADDSVVAIRDISPQAPTHVLLLSRKHVDSVRDLGEADHDLVGKIVAVAAELARRDAIAEDGYRLVVNVGRNGGQTVDHLHVHLLGGRPMAWPPG